MVTPHRNVTHFGHSVGASGYENADPLDILLGADVLTGVDVLRQVVDIIERGRPAWHTRGACVGSDIDFTSPNAAVKAAAIQLCGVACSEMAACRAWADEVGDTVAVLGGEDAAARRLRWRQRDAA